MSTALGGGWVALATQGVAKNTSFVIATPRRPADTTPRQGRGELMVKHNRLDE